MTRQLIPPVDVRQLYQRFDAPIAAFDCGQKCAPHNPSGKPFCCDICHAVPAAYAQEWDYLRANTDLWHVWRGDECTAEPEDPSRLQAETPDTMILLACLGPADCQRPYRTLNCRQFPFFPYITSDYRFLGLAYEWAYENTCWVISNLQVVTDEYRRQYIETYDKLFSLWDEEFESYAEYSAAMRAHFSGLKRRIPIIHRNGGLYLLSPGSERIRKTEPEHLPRFGPYKIT